MLKLKYGYHKQSLKPLKIEHWALYIEHFLTHTGGGAAKTE
jgi:hypothetical protein